jgi:PadR family transcriptional regulator PadR
MLKKLVTMFKEPGPSLGAFEVLCLSAVNRLGDGAYGIAVHNMVEELGGRKYLLPASYVTLDRLEEKGYLSSSHTEPTPERGGRRKRCYQLTPAGRDALKESAETAKRIYESWSSAPCKASSQKIRMPKRKLKLAKEPTD